MFTAKDARNKFRLTLDERIERAVNERRNGKGAHMRVYRDDYFRDTIEQDLRERGFTKIYVPDICLSGDVYFEWGEEED